MGTEAKSKMIFIIAAALIASVAGFAPQPSFVHPVRQTNRIVNGQEAVVGQFPWQASLKQNGYHFCGGSLVASKYIVSAAHCHTTNKVFAQLGVVDLLDDAAYKREIVSFTKHPNYSSQTLDYDYAVLEMKSDAPKNVDSVQPIEMAEAATNKQYSGTAITSGWGYTYGFDHVTPNQLYYSTLPLVSQSTCNGIWGHAVTITDRIQCAGGDGQSTVCAGDSGGPLVIQENGKNILIGITSWSESNCSTLYPGGWAKVAAGRNWIDSQMA